MHLLYCNSLYRINYQKDLFLLRLNLSLNSLNQTYLSFFLFFPIFWNLISYWHLFLLTFKWLFLSHRFPFHPHLIYSIKVYRYFVFFTSFSNFTLIYELSFYIPNRYHHTFFVIFLFLLFYFLGFLSIPNFPI